MIELYRLRPDGPQWPYSDIQLRMDEPHLSLSLDMPDHELATLTTLDPPILVWRVRPTSKPSNTRDLVWIQTTPEMIDGIPHQKWQSRSTTTAEKVVWDRENLPEPDWKTFKRSLLGDMEINQLLGGGLMQAPAAAISLPTTVINSSEGGDLSDFRAAWLALRRAGLVSQQLLHKVRMLAIQCNMPESFLSSIGGTIRPSPEFVGQEWVSSEGVLWVVVQARGENGQFVSDDPNTPEKESLMWILAE